MGVRETPVVWPLCTRDSSEGQRWPATEALFKKFALAVLASSRLDPSASLDFLWACIHVPRIWQGRDQRTPQAGLKGLV